MTVLLLHYINNKQGETRFITYEASLILMTPTPRKMVWNRCPYWGSFLSINNSWTGCMSALGVLKQLGHFARLELIVVDTPLTQAFCSLKVPTWHILCSSEYLGSKVVHLSRQNKSPSPKNTTVIFTHVIFVYMCGPWTGKGGRERQRERCVCKVSTHSHEIISDEEESEKDKYHMISLTCDILKKWTYL